MVKTAIGGFICASVLLLVSLTPTHAWVADHQPFPEGEATVVMRPYCRDTERNCAFYRRLASWETDIQNALRQWNNAGAGWRFHEEWGAGPADPCRPQDGQVLIIIATPQQMCLGDGPMRTDARIEYGSGWARIYFNSAREAIQGGDPSRLLLHELGHAVGLGHPDEAGQNVQAVMNSRVLFDFLQLDDIDGIRALYPSDTGPGPLKGFLENPQDGSFASGIGTISGWVCEARTILIWITETLEGGGEFLLAEETVLYGSDRPDTQGVCGDTHNGFGLLFNWNLLGTGTYTVTALVNRGNGTETLGAHSVTVATLGEEFLRGAEGEYVLDDFPQPGQSVTIEWEEALQNFVIVEHNP